MKLLIDECLHTSLCNFAHDAGFVAHHVTYLGLGGATDRELMKLILERDYTFVTNNRSDFLALYGRVLLHAGLILIIPSVTTERQWQLLQAALNEWHGEDPINHVLEIDGDGANGIKISTYLWPRRTT